MQHLAIFISWEQFLSETSGDINDIWERQKRALPPRLLFVVDNIQLLRRSAEDAKHDARQWAALSGETDAAANPIKPVTGEGDDGLGTTYLSDDIRNAMRFIDVLRSMVGVDQITAGSKEVTMMVKQLYRFQQIALCSTDDLRATMVLERGGMTMGSLGEMIAGTDIPEQDKVRSIKSQQASVSQERERMIQGIQERADHRTDSHTAAVYGVLNGFGEDEVGIMPFDSDTISGDTEPTTSVQFGPSTSFSEGGRELAKLFTLNRRQSIASYYAATWIEYGGPSEELHSCQFIGGEGGTGKSRIIEAVMNLFARRGMPHRLLITATSGTAAARINVITINSACKFSKDVRSGSHRSLDRITFGPARLRVDGQSRMDWEEKYMVIIDEISMLGARTLHAVNEQLCMLRGSTEDFGGIPIILFYGDFHQFRPVQERSILLSSSEIPWDEGRTFRVEQRHQHDKAHALWKRFTTVVMLKEQVRAAADPQLQGLLTRIRQGVGDQSDVDLLNLLYSTVRRALAVFDSLKKLFGSPDLLTCYPIKF